jgi:phosphate starvation-inducible PhoH-like protein
LKEIKIEINEVNPIHLLGSQDKHLHHIEEVIDDVVITSRGNVISVRGSNESAEQAQEIIEQMTEVIKRKGHLTDYDLDTLLKMSASTKRISVPEYVEGDAITMSTSGNEIKARTPNQKLMVDKHFENDIMFAIGPAGTGKTYTAVALAVRALKAKEVKKIVLCRPAVEAGESLGFLPGDFKEKIDPYLRPLYDALEEMIEHDKLDHYIQRNIIEIVPLAYMRGRTLNNSFVILDEAQNSTNVQLKMFLTRLGIHSKAIVTGDITQTDLPKKQPSGLISVQKILGNINGISFVYLNEGDVVRHKLIRDIIAAYDKHENE